MGGNDSINNLTSTITDPAAYNGYYWQSANTGINDLSSKLIYTEDSTVATKSNWNYGVTLNEDAVKEIVEKITKERELAKITPDNGPEIPKWTGFLDI